MTKISVLMPVYNQQNYLKKAIESILCQTFKNFEFLILDDASTDSSLKIIKNFKDKRIKIFSQKKRQGLAKSLNFLIKKAKGVYLARMDGDDVSEKNRLVRELDFLEKKPQVAMVGCWAKIIDKNGKFIGVFKYPTSYEQIKKEILKYNPFVHSSIMIRKKILMTIGGYDPNLFYSQDYDLFLKLASKYPLANLPHYLIRFRWQPDFKKQKIQHLTSLKIRIKAIKSYGYQKKEVFKIIKPFISYLTPIFIKKIYWQKKFNLSNENKV